MYMPKTGFLDTNFVAYPMSNNMRKRETQVSISVKFSTKMFQMAWPLDKKINNPNV